MTVPRNSIIISLILASCALSAFAQKSVSPTNQFTVKGKVKQEFIFSIGDTSKFTIHPIGDVTITNHLGEKRSLATRMRGILIKDILDKVEIDAESPKVLSEFYFTCVAEDGYKVVYSWNELFNTDIGNNAFLVTRRDGKGLPALDDRMLLISPKDFKTGRRYVKSLKTIMVNRVQ